MKMPAIAVPHKYFVLVAACLIPVSVRLAIFVTICWIILLPFSRGRKNPLESRLKNWLIVAALFICWQLVGFYFTSNLNNGLFNLQQKLALLMIPLGFASVEESRLPSFNELTFAFTLGLLLYAVPHLSAGIYDSITTSDINALNYTRLSPDIHPSYASGYLCLGVLLLVVHFNFNRSYSLRLFTGAVILFFCGFIFLLQSKAGLITSLLCITAITGYLFVNKGKQKALLVLMALITCSIVLIHHVFLSKDSQRIFQAIQHISSNKEIKPGIVIESNNARRLIWKAAFEKSIEGGFTGTGAGDVNDDLRASYKQSGLSYAEEKNLNAHNQYLQIWIAGGIPNLMLFMAWLLIPLILAVKQKNALVILLMLMLCMHLLTESMLESQMGLNFFPFIISILLLIRSPEQKLQSRTNVAHSPN